MEERIKSEITIGAVYSGISYQHGVLFRDEYRNIMNILPICEFGKIDLLEYDILIFPRGTDQEVVYAERKKIGRFLESKGILISFGEVTKEWIPGCLWDGVVPEDDGPLSIIEKAHPIFKDLKDEDLHWHKGATGWCCHGHFIAHPSSEILVTNKIGYPMVYIDRQSTKGIILIAGQLDAFCHIYAGIRGAEIFFENVLNWAENETKKLKGGE